MKTKKQILIMVLIFCITMFGYIKTHNYIKDRIKDKAEHIITKLISNMNNYHILHSATLLKNGNVLILGGMEGYDNVEIYNSKWKSFKIIRKEILLGISSANLLENGHVIITCQKGIVDFDPITNQFIVKNNSFSRAFHKTVLLKDGRIFICGGLDMHIERTSKECEIYNPINNTLISVGKLNIPIRTTSTNIDDILKDVQAILLPNGNVLILGHNFSVLFNSNTNKFFNYKKYKDKNMSIASALLINNKIFVVYHSAKDKKYNVRFGYYDIDKNIIIPIKTARTLIEGFEITILTDKNLLLTGVTLGTEKNNDIEDNNRGIYLFNTKNNTLKYLGNMKFSRTQHQSTLLKDNKTILITGGRMDCIKHAELLTLK